MDLQAVIFDYGEVLSGPPDPQAHRNLLQIAGVAEEPFEKAYWAHRLDYDADILNGQTYWQTVARDTGVHFTPEQISSLLEQDATMWMNLNPAMLAWIPRIKQAGFRLGILSNMGDGVLGLLAAAFSLAGPVRSPHLVLRAGRGQTGSGHLSAHGQEAERFPRPCAVHR